MTLDLASEAAGFRFEKLPGPNFYYKVYSTKEIDRGVKRTLTVTDADGNSLSIDLTIYLNGIVDLARLSPGAKPTLPDDMAAGPKADTTIEIVDANTWRVVTDIGNFNKYANERAPYGDVTSDGNLPFILEFDPNDFISGIPSSLLTFIDGDSNLLTKVNGKWRLRLDSSKSLSQRVIADGTSITITVSGTTGDAHSVLTEEFTIEFKQAVKLVYSNARSLDSRVVAMEVTDPRIHKYNERHWDVYYDSANPPEGSSSNQIRLFFLSGFRQFPRDGAGASSNSWGAKESGGLEASNSILLDLAPLRESLIRLNKRADQVAPGEGVVTFTLGTGVARGAQLKIFVNFKPFPYYAIPDTDQPAITDPDDGSRFLEVSSQDIDTRSWESADPDGVLSVTPGSPLPIIHLDLGSGTFVEDPGGSNPDRSDDFFTLSAGSDADGDGVFRYTISLNKNLDSSAGARGLRLRDPETGLVITLNIRFRQGFQVLDWRAAGPVKFDGSGGKDGKTEAKAYVVTVPADVAIGDLLSFKITGNREFFAASSSLIGNLDSGNQQYFEVVSRDSDTTIVLRKIRGDGNKPTPSSVKTFTFTLESTIVNPDGSTPGLEDFYVKFQIVAAAAARDPKFIGAEGSSPSYDGDTTIAAPSASTVSAVDGDGDGEVDTVRVSSTDASIAANDVVAIIIMDDDSDMTLTAPSGYTLSRLGPSYRYSLSTNADITSRTFETLKLHDGDGNLLEIKLEIWLEATDPVITSITAKPALPDEMPPGPKADATIQRVTPTSGSIAPNAGEGVWRVTTDLDNLNKYANELAPYGDENDDPDTLPYILEFDYSLFTAAVPLAGFTVVTVDPVDGGTDPKDSTHLKVIVVKDLASNKLRIRLDKDALAALRTISASRNTIEFEVQDSRDDSKKLTITITYSQVTKLEFQSVSHFGVGGVSTADASLPDYVKPSGAQPYPFYMAVEATDPRKDKYNEKVWDVYYDPDNPPVGSDSERIIVLTATTPELDYFDLGANVLFTVTGSALITTEYRQADGLLEILIVAPLTGQPTSKEIVYNQHSDASTATGNTLRLRLNFKPMPYYLPMAGEQPDVDGGKFVEQPQPPSAPFNERTWRLADPGGEISVAPPASRDILHLQLDTADYEEIIAADPLDYFEIVRDTTRDDIAGGKYGYKIRLKRSLTVGDGKKTIAIGDDETKFQMKLSFEVVLPPLRLVDAIEGRAGTEFLSSGNEDGSEAKPYVVTVPTNIPVGDAFQVSLNFLQGKIVAQDFSALRDGDGGYFEFAVVKVQGPPQEEALLFLLRTEGEPAKPILGGDRTPRKISVTIEGDGIRTGTIYFYLVKAAPKPIKPVIKDLAGPTADDDPAPNIKVSDPDGDPTTGNSILVESPDITIAANKALAQITIEDDGAISAPDGFTLKRLGTTYVYILSSNTDIGEGFIKTLTVKDSDDNELEIKLEVRLAAVPPFVPTDADFLSLPSGMPLGLTKDAVVLSVSTSSSGTSVGGLPAIFNMEYIIVTHMGDLNDYANEQAPYGDVTSDSDLPYILEFDLSVLTASVPIGELLIRAKSVDATATADDAYLQVEVILDPSSDKLRIRLDKTAAAALRSMIHRGNIEFTISDPRSTADDPRHLIITIKYVYVAELDYSVPASGQPVDPKFYAMAAAVDRTQYSFLEKVWNIYYDPAAPLDGSGMALKLFNVVVTASANELRIRAPSGVQNGITVTKDGDTYTVRLSARNAGEISREFELIEEDSSGIASFGTIRLIINFKSLAYFDSIPYSLAGITQPSLNGESFAELPQTPDTPNNERTWRLTNSNGRLDAAGILRLDLPSDTFVEEPDGDPDNYLRLRRVSSSDSGGKYRYVIQLRKTLSDTDGTKSIVLRDTATGFEIKILVEVKATPGLAITNPQAGAATLDVSGKDGTAANPYGLKAKVNVPLGELASFTLSGGRNYQAQPDFGALAAGNEPYFRVVVKDGNRLVVERIETTSPKARLTPEGPTKISVNIEDGDLKKTLHLTLQLEQLPLMALALASVDILPGTESFADGRNADRDGSEAKPYLLEVRVNAPDGIILVLPKSGDPSSANDYALKSQVLAALGANKDLLSFSVVSVGFVILSRGGADPLNIDLTPRTVSVTVSGGDIADTTFYFVLKVVPLLGARQAAADVVVDPDPSKDGSSAAKAIAITMPPGVNVGDVLSFALNGDGYSYEVKSPSLAALGVNKDFFEFVIDGNGKLVLRRKTGDLTATAAQTISVTIGGTGDSGKTYSGDDDAAADRTIYFSVEIVEPPKVTFVTDTDGIYKKPSLPAGMAAGPKADTTIQAESTAGQYTITTDTDNFNAYANELAPYGDQTGDDDLPDILEFSLADITPPGADFEVTAKFGPRFLPVEIRKEGGKLIIRLDEGIAANLRTMTPTRNRIGFTLTDPTSGETLEVIVTYDHIVDLGYSKPSEADQPAGVYAREVTDRTKDKYNEKVWDVYYDPAAPLDGSATPLALFLVNVSLAVSHTDSADTVLRIGAEGGDSYSVQLYGLIDKPAEKTVSLVDKDGNSLFIKVSFKPIPYLFRKLAPGDPFAELPQAPGTPANERTLRAVTANGRVGGTVIGVFELPNRDFKDAADPDGYLQFDAVFSIAPRKPGYAVYVLTLDKTLLAADGPKTVVIEDGSGFKMKIIVEVRRPLLVPDGQAENRW